MEIREGSGATHGYIKQGDKEKILARLRRIEGQVRGLQRMVEEEVYCVDILTQIGSVVSASEKVGAILLKDHVEHCVEGAIASGDGGEQRRKVQELLTVLTQRDR